MDSKDYFDLEKSNPVHREKNKVVVIFFFFVAFVKHTNPRILRRTYGLCLEKENTGTQGHRDTGTQG